MPISRRWCRSWRPRRSRGAHRPREPAIAASNYGEAAAINVYGRADGLPRAISGHNQYGLWGPDGHDGSVILRVNGNLERYREYCTSASLVATFGVHYAMPEENGSPIVLCRGLHQDLRAVWPEFIHIN